jgi:hypothetical protein
MKTTTIIISADTAGHLSEDELRLLALYGLLPIMGAEDPPEDDPDDPADDPEGESDDDTVEMSRADYKALKASADASRKAEAAREAAEKKAKDQKKKDEGEYESLLAEKDEQISSLEAERDGVMHEFDTHKRHGVVREQARKFGFKDPEDAIANLTDEDMEDENSVIRGLRRVSGKKPYLVDTKRATGAPIGTGVNGSGLSMEVIKNMSRDEMDSRREEVQEYLASRNSN